MKKIYITLMLSIMFTALSAQTIIGTITDSNTKEALIGVNIILENGEGTSTDINGNYKLQINKLSPIKLVFKYIGYINFKSGF